MIGSLIIYTFNITLALVIVLLNYNIPHRLREDRMILGLVFLILMEMLIQWGMQVELTADGSGGSIRFLIFGLMYAPIVFLIGQTKRDGLSLRKAMIHGIPFSIFMVLFLIWLLSPEENNYTQINWMVNGVVLLSFIAYFAAGMIFIRREKNKNNTLFPRFLFVFWGMGLGLLCTGMVVGIVFEFFLVNADLLLRGGSILLAGFLVHLYRIYFSKLKQQYLFLERNFFSFESLILDLFAKEALESIPYTPKEEDEEETNILAQIDFFDPEINISSLASQMNVSISFIEKRIKEETGTSFKKFLNKKRIEYAKILLEKNSDLPIRELMLRSGFQSPATFYRNFRNYTGVSPKEYKTQVSNKNR